MSKPCLILGNGPSVKRVPAAILEAMPNWGVNYAMYSPHYYVCVDKDILTSRAEDIRDFVKYARIAYLSELLLGVNDLYEYCNVHLVGKDTQSFKAEQYMSGLTATYVCLKQAYYLGYDEIHLYGVDHSPAWEHYREDYPIGKKTNSMHMQVMEYHYRLAANVYARAGRTIINHSDPSKLDAIFRRA